MARPGVCEIDECLPVIHGARAAADLRQQVVNQLRVLDAASGRAIVYPVGAAEALLLDATRPGWRARYLAEPFDLGRYIGE